MASLNMPKYSFILTTTLLFCALVVVTGRSVESEVNLPEGIVFDSSNIDDEDDVEARYMSSGSGSGSGPSSSTIESIIQQIMSLFQDQGSQQPNIIIVPLGGGSSSGGVSSGSGSGGSIPVGQIVQAALPEIVAASVSNNGDTTRRRRRRRRRPVNRRINRNRRRRPSGRQVFVLRTSDTQ